MIGGSYRKVFCEYMLLCNGALVFLIGGDWWESAVFLHAWFHMQCVSMGSQVWVGRGIKRFTLGIQICGPLAQLTVVYVVQK